MFFVKEDICIGCCQCVKDCPVNDIFMQENKKAHVKNEACIKCGHCVAICPVEAVATTTYDMEEVIPYDADTFTIPATTLLNFIKFRRSVRQFKKKSVEKEKLLTIIESGRYTETSTNAQDVSYVILEKSIPEVRDAVMKILNEKSKHILATLTNETMHLKRYALLWAKMYELYQSDPVAGDRIFFNAPAAILVTADQPVDASLAASNMELMIHALGLGGFFSGFLLVALSDQPELLTKFGVPEGKKLVNCLVLGYPKVIYKRTVPRKKPEIIWK